MAILSDSEMNVEQMRRQGALRQNEMSWISFELQNFVIARLSSME